MLFGKKKEKTERWDKNRLPKHIAIIMDGNGRWAEKRGLPRSAGHAAGSETFRTIATYCKDIGVPYLTVYAFSTENWKRSKDEISAIMSLLERYLHEAIEKMERDRIRLTFFGDLTPIPDSLKALIDRTNHIYVEQPQINVNVCLNYGGRAEILRAAQKFAMDCVSGKCAPWGLTEEAMSDYMYSEGVPDPDLVIRPSGEIRTSNFLLWQSAYSEYYFTDILWPDFTPAVLDGAIVAYQKRSRRFGGR